jgi:hypothetical protein
MRKNLNKLARIVFALSIALLLANCDRNEPLGLNGNAQNASIQEARTWFDGYKTEVAFDTIFKNLEYHWEKANLKILVDSTRAITVPVISTKQGIDYNGEKVLYLYPKKGESGFNTTLIETIPGKNHLNANRGFINLNTFEGYMVRWDLENGFDRGTLFKNGKPVADIDLKVIKVVAGGLSVTGRIMNKEKPPIELKEVKVSGGTTTNDGYYYQLQLSSAGVGSGGSYQGTASNYGGATYAGGAAKPNIQVNSKDNSNYNKTPCEKLKAQKNNLGYNSRLADLKKNTGLTYETGYRQEKDGSLPALELAPSTGTTDGLKFTVTKNTVGFMHVHTDAYEDPVRGLVTPYKMFSPQDVSNLFRLVGNAIQNNNPIDDVYGMVVTSGGVYEIKYTGSPLQNTSTINWGSTATEDAYKTAINLNGPEAGLLSFLKDYAGVTGVELFRAEESGDFTSLTIVNGAIIAITCEELKTN